MQGLSQTSGLITKSLDAVKQFPLHLYYVSRTS